MSQDDGNLDFAYLARVTAQSMFANVSLTLVEIGIHLFMAIYGLSVYLETSKAQRRGRGPCIAISFLITGLTALTGCLEAPWAFRILFETPTEEAFYDVRDKYLHSWIKFLSMSAIQTVVVIGDGFLVYRCCMMWSHRKWLPMLPLLTYLASCALGVASIIVYKRDPYATLPYEAAFVFCTVATNIMVTTLISFYLIRARRHLSELFSATSGNQSLNPSPPSSSDPKEPKSHSDEAFGGVYIGIVAILIESALPLTVSGIAYAVIVLLEPRETNLGYASMFVLLDLFAYLFYGFSALAPHMIIFRVTIGRSWLKPPGIDHCQTNGEQVSANLEFKHSVPGESASATSSVRHDGDELEMEIMVDNRSVV